MRNGDPGGEPRLGGGVLTVVALKGFKTLAAASEETTCFSATILVDGRRAGTASNDGRGGSHRYRWDDRAVGDAVEAWADSLDLEFAHEKLDQVVDRLAAAISGALR